MDRLGGAGTATVDATLAGARGRCRRLCPCQVAPPQDSGPPNPHRRTGSSRGSWWVGVVLSLAPARTGARARLVRSPWSAAIAWRHRCRRKEPLHSSITRRVTRRGSAAHFLRAVRDNFRDNRGVSSIPRNSQRVVYLDFSPRRAVSERSESHGEVAERLKAAVC